MSGLLRLCRFAAAFALLVTAACGPSSGSLSTDTLAEALVVSIRLHHRYGSQEGAADSLRIHLDAWLDSSNITRQGLLNALDARTGDTDAWNRLADQLMARQDTLLSPPDQHRP